MGGLRLPPPMTSQFPSQGTGRQYTRRLPQLRPPNALRMAFLEERGYRVLRFWNNEVNDSFDGVLHEIAAALAEQSARKPSPYPLPHAGEGED